MKRVILNYLVVTTFALSALLIACQRENNDENDGTANNTDSFVIEATNVINSIDNTLSVKDIATVKAFLYSPYNDSYDIIATGKCENGGFKLILPNPVDNKLLTVGNNPYPIKWVSDSKAKISGLGAFQIIAYDNAGNIIGGLHYCYGGEDVYGYYVYVDRNFTIIGGPDWDYWNCTFNKGWNIIYAHDEYTTQKPSGVDVRWYYQDNF